MRTQKTLQKRKGKMQRDWLLFYILVAAFPVLQFCVFYIGVNANMITKAFSAYDINTGTYVFNGIENFRKIFFELENNPVYSVSLKNSLLAYVIITGVSLPLSLLMSYYIFKKCRGHKLFRSILFLPSIISPMVLSTIFRIITDKIYPELVYKFTGEYVPGLLMNESRTVFLLAVFYTIWTGFGVTTMMYRGAMDGVTPSMLEAASLDGAGEFTQFYKIILPMIFPTISVFLLTGITGIFMNQINLYNIFSSNLGDQMVKTFGYQFFLETSKATLADYPRLTAIGLLLSIITIPVVLGLRKLFNKLDPTEG